MSDAHINYIPRPDANPEGEAAALAAVYRYVLFDSYASRGGDHDPSNGVTVENPEHGPMGEKECVDSSL